MSSDGTDTVQQTACSSDHFSRLPEELIQMIVERSVEDTGMDERAKWLGGLRRTSHTVYSAISKSLSLRSSLCPVISTRVTNDPTHTAYQTEIASVAHCLQVVPTSNGDSQIHTVLSIDTDRITKLWIKVPGDTQQQDTFFRSLLDVKGKFNSVICARVDFVSSHMTYACWSPTHLRDLSQGLTSLKEICLTNVPELDLAYTYHKVPGGVRTIGIYSPRDGRRKKDKEWTPEKQFLGWLTARGLYGSHLPQPEKPSYTLVLERSLTGYSVEDVRQGMNKTLDSFCDKHGHDAQTRESFENRISCTDRWAMFEDPPVGRVTYGRDWESENYSGLSV